MKNFNKTAAFELIAAAAKEQQNQMFYSLEVGKKYELLADLVPVKNSKGEEIKKLQLKIGESIKLITKEALTGFFMAKDSDQNFRVLQTQTLDDVKEVIKKESTFVVKATNVECLIYSRKYAGEEDSAKEGEVFIATPNGKQFWAKPGFVWEIVSA